MSAPAWQPATSPGRQRPSADRSSSAVSWSAATSVAESSGYPTANVPTSGMAAAPADGVYAGWLRRLDTGERYPAAISVGTNPTFEGERERRVESYVLDRDDLELYDVEVEVAFVDRIRGMVRFDGVDALVETMRGDVVRAHEILGVPIP